MFLIISVFDNSDMAIFKSRIVITDQYFNNPSHTLKDINAVFLNTHFSPQIQVIIETVWGLNTRVDCCQLPFHVLSLQNPLFLHCQDFWKVKDSVLIKRTVPNKSCLIHRKCNLLLHVVVSFFSFYLNSFQESNGPSDAYAAISNADRLQAEPESLRKWREEQRERLEVLGNVQYIRRFVLDLNNSDFFFFLSLCPSSAVSLSSSWTRPISASLSADKNSRKQEAEWKEKAKVELEDWHARQNEQLEKTKTNNRYCFCRSFVDLYTNVPAFDRPRKVFLWFWCLFKAKC